MTPDNHPFFQLLKKENLPALERANEVSKVLGSFNYRSDLISALGLNSGLTDGLVFSDGVVQYIVEEGSTVIPDLPGLKPFGKVYPDHWAENTTPGVTDMSTAIDSAVSYLKTELGGVLYFKSNDYLISSKIVIDYPIVLEGESSFFANDYVDDGLIRYGSWITLAAGSNVDCIQFIGNDTLSGVGYPRIHAGMRHIGVHGNRSTSQSPTTTDLNVGNGVVMSGASYVSLTDVTVMRAGDNGIVSESATIGGTVRSCNNLQFSDVRSISNASNGFELSGGDSKFHNLVGGYNGNDGYNGNMGPVTGSKFWNNGRYGMFLGSFHVAVLGTECYDNFWSGIHLSESDGHIVNGCNIYDNGNDGTQTGNNRAGISIASAASNVTIVGNFFAAINDSGTYDPDPQLYGVSATSGTPTGVIGCNTSENLTSLYFINDDSGLNFANSQVGLRIRDVIDDSASAISVTTSPQTLFTASAVGALYEVRVTHDSGTNALVAQVLGHGSSPLIVYQDSIGSSNLVLTVSGTNIQLATGSGALTCSWNMARKV